ncbi:permease-like cell division protein FtsX [Atopobacter phocae]|uniref:permease-like cell division protein FtsX n=1 Tax=Atopobacter phocae TaxID=136492 RepID=UPI000472057C|nr:permease-like cell division protein FtsX [Atopobacter phocae]
MIIRNFFRHVRDAIKGLTRNGLLTFASITAVSLTLLLFSFSASLLMNVNEVASSVESDVTIKVFIDVAASKEDQNKLLDAIEKQPHVKKAEYRTKEQELEDLIKSQGENFDLFEDDSNPLKDTIIVYSDDPQETKTVAKAIQSLQYVSEVNYGGASVEKFLQYIATTRNIGIGILIALLIVAVFLISNTVRTAIYSRQTEIEIMRLVGAKNSYIRAPFFMEGGIIGFLGSIIPIILFSGSYLFVYDRGMNFLSGTAMKLIEPFPHVIYISGAMCIIGIVIGSFGSMFSISRFLKY